MMRDLSVTEPMVRKAWSAYHLAVGNRVEGETYSKISDRAMRAALETLETVATEWQPRSAWRPTGPNERERLVLVEGDDGVVHQWYATRGAPMAHWRRRWAEMPAPPPWTEVPKDCTGTTRLTALERTLAAVVRVLDRSALDPEGVIKAARNK